MPPSLEPNEAVPRRINPRYPLSMRVWAVAEKRGAWLQVTDVSVDGVGCLCERKYPLMSSITLNLDVTGGRGDREFKPLEIEAIVCRCAPQDGSWRLGLRLPHHNPMIRERFERFLRSRILDQQQPLERNQG